MGADLRGATRCLSRGGQEHGRRGGTCPARRRWRRRAPHAKCAPPRLATAPPPKPRRAQCRPPPRAQPRLPERHRAQQSRALRRPIPRLDDRGQAPPLAAACSRLGEGRSHPPLAEPVGRLRSSDRTGQVGVVQHEAVRWAAMVIQAQAESREAEVTAAEAMEAEAKEAEARAAAPTTSARRQRTCERHARSSERCDYMVRLYTGSQAV
jgi:hypothetical protein